LDLSANGHLKQLMVDSLKDYALVLLDTDGKVLSWNAGAQNLLGYEEAQAVGQPYARIVPPEARDPNGAPLSLTIARKKGRHEEIGQRIHSSGKDLELHELVVPLRDPQHNLVAFGLMMQSVEAARRAGNGSALRPSMTARPTLPTVLLVDDDDQVRTTSKCLLEDLNYEVLAVASGSEALDALRRNDNIDVLFTDVVMPGMDGGELAEQARLLRPELKILFTSGYFAHALIQKGNISPDTNLLVKPYRPRDLARKMNTLLADDVSSVLPLGLSHD
jgi:PAS domain S-box-containing protein